MTSEQQFTDFVQANRTVLGRTAMLLCGDRATAEDLVQEALIRTFQTWRKVEPGKELAYLRRIMTNLTIDRWRRRRFEAPPQAEHEHRPDARSAAAFDGVDARDTIARSLRALSPRERAMVVLRYYHDLSEAEVARELGVSLGTVKSTCSRALAKMRVEQATADDRRVS